MLVVKAEANQVETDQALVSQAEVKVRAARRVKVLVKVRALVAKALALKLRLLKNIVDHRLR